MPDFRDAMRGAGLQSSKAPGPPKPAAQDLRGPPAAAGNPFKPPYPQYFHDQALRVSLVLDEAEAIAALFERDRLKKHQLRAFYDHAKRQLQRLTYGTRFAEVWPEIARLKAFAADRAGRAENALPPSFKQFIDLNVAAVVDRDSFQKGFIPHFEAVVAYSARIIKD